MEQVLLRQAMTTISKRVVQEILKASTSKLVVSAGIGTTVYLASRTALAAPASAQGGGKPTPSDEVFQDPIGTQVTRMFMLRPEPRPALPPPGLDAPAGKRKPYAGEPIDAVKFSPQAAAEAKSRGEASAPCRYIGEVILT
jgi:hypothetical protein